MMVEWHDLLPTTMDVAHARAEQGAPHGTAIAARRQSAGRGRRGRAWESPEGGLWLSVVCRPSGPAGLEHLSLRAGLAVAEALEVLIPGLPRLMVKLPNDLLLGGRKLAGILCEARWEGGRPLWVIAAIGLNVRNPIPAALAEQAVSLSQYAAGVDPQWLAEPLAAVIAEAALKSGLLSDEERHRLAEREPVP